MWRRRRVLVTGATGFVGGHLAARLAALGAAVSALPGRAAGADPGGVLRGAAPDVVFHLAAETSPGAPEAALAASNVDLTRALLLAAAGMARPPRFVHVGTCGEYGDAPSPLREDGPCLPRDAYGRTKLEATRLALAASRALPVVVARPFLTFGPGQRGARLMPSLLCAAASGRAVDLTPGEQSRDVVYVRDVVEALLRLSLREESGIVVNVGSGVPRTLREIGAAILDAAGIPAGASPLRFGALPYRAGEPMTFHADVTRQQALLGEVAATPLPEALRESLAWYRARPDADA